MDALRAYAEDWDRTLGGRASYFTQEYWYLFVGCLVRYWQEHPVTVSEACQLMLTGSNRTREDRIKRAVLDGYLIKRRADSDARNALVLPSPKLEELMRAHFRRTLVRARASIGPCDT